jgi:hypothetical protein
MSSGKNDEVVMNIRIPRELRDTFISICKTKDTTGSREVREFMRKYIARHSQQKLL